MKNLKRILATLLVFILFITGVVFVASASDYTGKLEDAISLFEDYERANSTSKKQQALKAVYKYASATPIDPESAYTFTEKDEESGEDVEVTITYKEFETKYNSAVMAVADTLYTVYTNAAQSTAKITEINKVFAHLSVEGSPVMTQCEGTAPGYAEFEAKLLNANEELVRAILDESVASADVEVKKTNIALVTDQLALHPIDTESETYDAFYEKFNVEKANTLHVAIDGIYAVDGSIVTSETAAKAALLAFKTAFAAYEADVAGLDAKIAEAETAADEALKAQLTAIKDAIAAKAALAALVGAETPDEEAIANARVDYSKAILAALNLDPAYAAAKAGRETAITQAVNSKNANLRDKLSSTVSVMVGFAATYPVDPAVDATVLLMAEFEDKLDSLEVAWLALALAQYDEDMSAMPADEARPIAYRTVAIGKVDAVVGKISVPEDAAGYAELLAKVKVITKEYEAAVALAEKALDEDCEFDEYELDAFYYKKYDFEDSKLMSNHNGNASTKAWAETMPDGNKVMTLDYAAAPPHLYTEPSHDDVSRGVVIDMDMMVDENFVNCSFHAHISGTYPEGLFTLSQSGGVYQIASTAHTDQGIAATTVKNVIAPNRWFHLTFTYDHETKLGKVYINYEHVLDIGYGAPEYKSVRIGGGTSTPFQKLRFDNVEFYAGTAYRNVDKFKSMGDVEKFNYYVDYFNNENYTNPESAKFRPLSCNSAYIKAKELESTIRALVDSTTDEELKANLTEKLAAYDEFVQSKYAELVANAKMANLKKIKSLVAEIQLDQINSETMVAVNAQIATIESFIVLNSDYIDKTNSEYLDQLDKVDEAKAAIIRAENIVTFIKALVRFNRATTLTSMQRYANLAAEIYKTAGYDKGVFELVKGDPFVADFEVTINVAGADPADAENFIDAQEFYATFAEKLAARERYENSKRVVNCLSFIIDEEGYEATEEYFRAHFDRINNYITIIRDVIASDNYDKEYAGINEAIAEYNKIDSFFYTLLQEEHYNHLVVQLDKFVVSNSYIEKVGICTYVESYLAANDIDESREDLSSIIYRLAIYQAELEQQKVDYEALLEQNTQYFIDTVRKMTSVVTYAELKPLYDEAASYYYAMNIDSDEAKNAIELYAEYEALINLVEESSALFLGYTTQLRRAVDQKNQDAIYRALVNCMSVAENVDESISGVANAMEIYEKNLATYNDGAIAVNGQITSAANVVSAVRTNSIAAAILAIFNQISAN